MPPSPAESRYHRCPRCGSRLARDEGTGTMETLARLVFLRGLRCKPNCGWRGFRFSRSLFRRRKRRIMVTLVVGLFLVLTAVIVRYVLLRTGPEQGGRQGDGVQEIDP